MILVILVPVLAGAGVALGVVGGRRLARSLAVAQAGGDAEPVRIRRDAEAAATKAKKEAELAAREQALALQKDAAAELSSLDEQVIQTENRCRTSEQALAEHEIALEERDRQLGDRHGRIRDREQSTRTLYAEARTFEADIRTRLEQIAGETAIATRDRLAEGWIEETRAACAQRLRTLDQSSQDPEYTRTAKRIMGIAIQRYQGHYLTERLLSNLPLVPGTAERVMGKEQEMARAIEEVAGIKMTLSDAADSIRLEGLDGVGREVARRAITRLVKGTAVGADKDPAGFVQTIKQNLEREIQDLGRRAFAELEIPRAHPEIVELVGRLNYRTSYTQNQWKHAVEAAFLCGMMASELGLDIKLARRAALMHDIGKALTHSMDGSHAVIGADYARRLGEAEVVANAIGAHHAEEPSNSVYAFLVAAGDAMSGARPGARREMTENYVGRIQDLERIAARFKGVDRAYPVQAGREVRVYVREGEVSDERAVELSTEIAKTISSEMTFPGQIKVTVVREMRAVEVAS
jgi:ribonuclease Y